MGSVCATMLEPTGCSAPLALVLAPPALPRLVIGPRLLFLYSVQSRRVARPLVLRPPFLGASTILMAPSPLWKRPARGAIVANCFPL